MKAPKKRTNLLVPTAKMTRENNSIQAVVMDFDGTLSTLRCGWEKIMHSIMVECLVHAGQTPPPELVREIDDYIHESTGIQTISQMKWLVQALQRQGRTDMPTDPWYYKELYNQRLMEMVGVRRDDLENGRLPAANFLIPGGLLFIQALHYRGIKIFLASGTDTPDVQREARALGLDGYCTAIRGAEPHSELCSKSAVIEMLLRQSGFRGDQLAVIGDGPVEIRLGRQYSARTIGICSDEMHRNGPNPVKAARLQDAGADMLAPDFTDLRTLLDFLGLSANPQLDFAGLKTFSATGRHNLVTVENLLKPGEAPVPEWSADGFDELCDRLAAARRAGRHVLLSMGAHVIKNNLSLYLIELMRRGIVTHLAGNGACSIHDFELAYLGGTSEHVPTAIEDGSFGMWEETGRWMNEAIQAGVAEGYGYGESLARYIDAHPARFPHRDACVLYQAWRFGVPATYHIALGTDIIHQHPSCDFAALGAASGRDFHTYCHTLSQLDGGCFLNFGSSVIGPEVFLKALSISRNLGCQTFHITTANFDLINLGDYRCKIGYDDPNYYYRPRKNIVNRPVSCGGKGWHFQGDHKQTIPNLYQELCRRGL